MRTRISGLLVLLCGLAAAPSLHAQQRTGAALGLDPTPLELPAFRLAPLDAVFVSRPFAEWLEEWTAETRSLLAANERRMLLRRRYADGSPDPAELAQRNVVNEPDSLEIAAGRPVAQAPDTVSFLPPIPLPQQRGDGNLLGGVLGEHADLGIRIQGLGNLGGAWTRHNPCDPSVQFTCKPNMFPELKPDMEFAIRAGGTISQRVHVDVDYDQTREFDAANNINVYYQGLRDEVLQRVEFGDVSIDLPASRYLTRGVPRGNFGLMAEAQLGPLELQTVFAQQKGDLTAKEFRFGAGGQAGMEQDAELVIDDADYVEGQFFFLVPPAELIGTPHIDVLALRSTDAPASIRPGVGGGIQIFRDERRTGQTASQPGQFLAEAMPATSALRHTGTFRRLVPEQDYFVHSSGLWIMLRAPLTDDEALAVSFITENGDTVGMMNPESAPGGTTPLLRLLRGPAATHQPGSGTWDMEMHQVYRLDSSGEVDPAEIELSISLGAAAGGNVFRDVLGQRLTFLRFFGLDEDAPVDRLDEAQVLQPAREGFGAGGATPIGGTYIVFPTLRPFAEPADVRSVQVDAPDLLAALGADANEAIYDDVDPVNRASSARFQLNFKYRVKVDGLQSSFNLGAFGLRENSERLYLGTRLLERDADYRIDYELGVITLNDPQTLFATAPQGAELRATWEQKPLFSIAPTSVFGASAKYTVGNRGELNFVGLYQSEKSLMSRPQLGVEPGSAFLGGVSGRFDLGGALLDRLVGSIPGMRITRPSSMLVTGELAFSLPNPNRAGVAYLEDFEGTEELPLGLRRQDWKLGSAPQTTQGDDGTLPPVVDASSAWPIVWQHDFWQNGAISGALLPASQIDQNINFMGTERPEQVMWLTFGSQDPNPLPPPADPRRWRSITTLLSTTGRDMSRSEYIEFYVSAGRNEPLALILDIGTISEDGFYIDSLGNTSGTYDDGRPWGIGMLDEEARIIEREVWGTDKDARGLWNQSCRVEPLATYELTDPRANCTRGNGLQDTEDLNGNGILDGDDGQYFRYVVHLDQMSEYLVRDTSTTKTGFRLYRIPLRAGEPVNGATDATWRFIRHLRMTVAGQPQSVRLLSIARMRIVGSRWAKRDVHGVQSGLLDAQPGAGSLLTDVRVGPVSAVTDGAVYQGPPGVEDRAQDQTQNFDRNGLEINEKSLRLAYTDLEGGDRAEVFYRYPQQPRNMLTYRQLRLWVLPREGDFGPDGTQRFTLRIGSDPRNFYLYQSKLRPPTGPRAVVPDDWRPEIVIDFKEWFDLKAEAERRLIERGPATARIDTLWSADSTYAIVLEDRARAPNLAAVRELVFAVYNSGSTPSSGEIWIDDMRVGVPDTEPGAAGNITLAMTAGDLVTASVSVSNQGPVFRQLNETPRYVGGSSISFGADARLGLLLPASWGVDLPVTVTHARNEEQPVFLQQTDVQADQLQGLRSSGSDATSVGVRLSKTTPTRNPVLSLLVDGSALRFAYTKGESRSLTSSTEQSGFTADLSYRRDLAPRALPRLPDFILDIFRAAAPGVLENSAAFQRLLGARLRWSPTTISFGSSYNDHLTRSFRYDRILALPGDSSVIGLESPRHGLRNNINLGLRPFEPLSLAFGLSSDRDLLQPERASTQPLEVDALHRARSRLGGMDVGWERSRALNTTMSFRPDLTRWLRTDYTFTTRYTTDRNPSYLEIDTTAADTTAEMQRRFEASRQIGRRITVQPSGLALALGLDTTRIAGRLISRFQTIDFDWRSTLSSYFERESFLPGLGYQIGLGNLESFKHMGADTAARAQSRNEFRTNTGILLVPGLRLDVGYHRATTEAFDARGGTRLQRETGWPKGTLAYRPPRIPDALSGWITSFSTSAGVENIERRTDYLGQDQQRGGTELRFPVSVSVGLPRGFYATYRGSYSTGETLDPTGGAESGGMQHDLSVSAVLPAGPLAGQLSAPIGVTLTFSQQGQRQCRYSMLAEAEGCIAFLDLGTRSANLFLESKIRDVTVGMQTNYIGRQNHVGTRNGSSQFQVGFYGRFNVTAGQMPARYR